MILEALDPGRIAEVRGLFREYAESLGFDLCFQGFSAELAGLPGDYAPPEGALLLAMVAGNPTGCVALRRWDREACEMKRLYVRPACRGLGLGRALAETVVARGRMLGYRRMLLDTLDSMEAALDLYASLGFRKISPYYANPIPGACYLSLEWAPGPADKPRF